jgi:lipopolysaccharide/colanic/teichoic acid biosynthesis glycosyltransferase
MVLQRLLDMLPWWPDRSGNAALRGLHCAKTFRRMLVVERDRADRLGDSFSLLSLGIDDWRRGRGTLAHLAKTMRRRLRSTDEAGWLDGRHIGVILPGTPAWGAWTVADDLCRCLPVNTPLPECKVYHYPGDGVPGDSDGGRLGAGRRSVARQRSAASMALLFCRRLPRWKRALDVAVSSIVLLLVSPLLAVVALLIKRDSPGPILFAQRRSGLGGKPFVLYKLRTMVLDAEVRKRELLALNEQDGPAFKVQADPRVTRIGRLLRAASIDELPQLWNVLRGEMSLVGPRPLPCAETEGCRGWQLRRLDVTPGVTCIWQVRGRSRVSFAEWMRMDIRYIGSRSLWGDLKLLLHTVPALLLRKGW